MKHLFAVTDLRSDKTKLYSLDAPNESIACQDFVNINMPLMEDWFEYRDFCEILDNQDIKIEYMGTMENIISLK